MFRAGSVQGFIIGVFRLIFTLMLIVAVLPPEGRGIKFVENG